MAKLVLVNLDMKQNQLVNVVMEAGSAPKSPIAGQFYYDTTQKHAYVYNGTSWEIMGNVESVVDSEFNNASSNALQNKKISTSLVGALNSSKSATDYTITADAPLAKSGASSKTLSTVTIPLADYTDAGLMSPSDKITVDGVQIVDELTYTSETNGVKTEIKSGGRNLATATIDTASNTSYGVVKVDSRMSAISKNPVQNNVISAQLDEKAYAYDAVNVSGFSVTQDENQVDINYGNITGTIDYSVNIDKATSTQTGVVLLDSSVTSSGANPVTGKAIADYVGSAIAASDAMIFKGTLGTNGTITALPTTYKTGWTYRVITAGTYAGNKCEIGDLIIALVDRTGSGNADADWTVAQTNIDGAITSISGTSPISVSGTGASRSITHKTSGVTAGSYGLSSTATPAFGAKFNVPYVTVDTNGHLTAASTKTVTIPSTEATTSTNGLMTTTHVSNLNKALSSDTTTVTANVSTVDIGLASIKGTAKTLTLPAATTTKAGVMTKDQVNNLNTAYSQRIKKVTGTIAANSTSATLNMTSASSTVVSVNAYIGTDEVIVDVNDTGDGDVVVSIAKAITSPISIVLLYADSL